MHTHCGSLRVALAIKNNVLHRRVPKTANIRTLQSHIRVTRDKKYIDVIESLITSIKGQRGKKQYS